MNEQDSFEKMLDMLIDEGALQALPKLEEERDLPEVIFSKEHEAKMEKLFRQERNKEKRKKLYFYASRSAACFAVLAVVSSICIFSVQAWRARFLNFVMEVSETNTKLSFQEEEKEGSSDSYTLGYIPEGFSLEQQNRPQENTYLLYIKRDLYFSFSVGSISGTLRVDTEDAVTKTLTVNGMEAFFSSKSDLNILVWHNNENVFDIIGNISEEEMIKIAENIKI